jgi:hypothetical protein
MVGRRHAGILVVIVVSAVVVVVITMIVVVATIRVAVVTAPVVVSAVAAVVVVVLVIVRASLGLLLRLGLGLLALVLFRLVLLRLVLLFVLPALRAAAVVAIVVAIAVLGSLTVLPALLSWLGPRVNALRLPGRNQQSVSFGGDRFWSRWARMIMQQPRQWAAVAVVILLVLAAPLIGVAAPIEVPGAITAIGTLVVGYAVFKRLEPGFADYA